MCWIFSKYSRVLPQPRSSDPSWHSWTLLHLAKAGTHSPVSHWISLLEQDVDGCSPENFKNWKNNYWKIKSHLQWSFSLLFQFLREEGNYILIPAGMRVKCGKILYLNFIPKQRDFRPWIGSEMWKSLFK